MDLGLQGARALITGASRGIGYYAARALREEGASVAICGRGAERLAEAAGELRAIGHGGQVFSRVTDIAGAEDVRAYAREAVDALGGLDIFIHNASAFGGGAGDEAWLANLNVDALAAVRVLEVTQPALQESGKGAVLFIGSTASVQWFGRASPYGPLKAAMRVYANEMGQVLGRKGIRVNALSPGATWFPGGSWDRTKEANPDFYRNVEKSIPFGRLGTGEEVARVITFLVSPAASWVNGTHVIVDGGQHVGVA